MFQIVLLMIFNYFGIWHASCYILNTYFGIHKADRLVSVYAMDYRSVFTGATVLVARFGHPALCAPLGAAMGPIYLFKEINGRSAKCTGN